MGVASSSADGQIVCHMNYYSFLQAEFLDGLLV
jgi:hypothetical protein